MQRNVDKLHHELTRIAGLILSGVSKFSLPTPDPELGKKLCYGAVQELEALAKELVKEEKCK